MTFSKYIVKLAIICFSFAGLSVFAAAQEWGWGRDRGYDNDGGGYRRSPPSQPTYAPPRPSGYGWINPRCKELEFQLAGGFAQSGSDQLPRIEAEMRQVEGQYHRVRSDAESSDCYEDMFLFGRSLRRNNKCIELDRQVQAAKSRLASLKSQRDAAARGNSPRGRRDELIAELARNRCGDQYTREHEQQRSRSNSIFSFFSDEESDDTSRSQLPYSSSTFKTMCVRLCDGFYFPVTYATTESQFAADAQKCQTQCAAPAELYVVRTDQDVEQMTSFATGRPYTQMPNAFRNRKVYIKGCSCNASEFSREEIAKSEEALRQPSSKRAEVTSKPTASETTRTPLPPLNAPATIPTPTAPLAPPPNSEQPATPR